MFMVGQEELPGRGKRELHGAVAEKDIALAQTDARFAPIGVARSDPRVVERGTSRSVATVTSTVRSTRFRSRWS
jgi:hypothetical protein